MFEWSDPENLARAIRRLQNPPPGSAIAAARDFGVDLTLLIERLRLTPEERLRELQRSMLAIEAIHGAAQRQREDPQP